MIATIALAVPGRPTRVRALVIGPWAVHRSVDDYNRGWRVTHIGCGCAIVLDPSDEWTLSTALAVARALPPEQVVLAESLWNATRICAGAGRTSNAIAAAVRATA